MNTDKDQKDKSKEDKEDQDEDSDDDDDDDDDDDEDFVSRRKIHTGQNGDKFHEFLSENLKNDVIKRQRKKMHENYQIVPVDKKDKQNVMQKLAKMRIGSQIE